MHTTLVAIVSGTTLPPRYVCTFARVYRHDAEAWLAHSRAPRTLRFAIEESILVQVRCLRGLAVSRGVWCAADLQHSTIWVSLVVHPRLPSRPQTRCCPTVLLVCNVLTLRSCVHAFWLVRSEPAPPALVRLTCVRAPCGPVPQQPAGPSPQHRAGACRSRPCRCT